jgi:hypothetical protein
MSLLAEIYDMGIPKVVDKNPTKAKELRRNAIELLKNSLRKED